MLMISEELRDNINKFISGIQVPVSVAPNFLEVIKALSQLQEIPSAPLAESPPQEVKAVRRRKK